MRGHRELLRLETGIGGAAACSLTGIRGSRCWSGGSGEWHYGETAVILGGCRTQRNLQVSSNCAQPFGEALQFLG